MRTSDWSSDVCSSDLVHTIDALVKVNSGMNRLGFQPSDYRAAFQRALALQDAGVLGELGKMTHFACADDDPEATRVQLDTFYRATDGLPGKVRVCNSDATSNPGVAAPVVTPDGRWVRHAACVYGPTP